MSSTLLPYFVKSLVFFTLTPFLFAISVTIKVVDTNTQIPLEKVEIVELEGITTKFTTKQGVVTFELKTIASFSGNEGQAAKRSDSEAISFLLTKEGYRTLEVSLLKKDLKSVIILFLHPEQKGRVSKKRLSEIFVESDPFENNAKKYIHRDTLTSERQGNFNDITKTIQTLPGVSSSGSSFDSTLYVQGGGEDEWTANYDNIYIARPIRWNGGISMFNPVVIDSLDFYTAGYGSAFGQGLSAVLDTRTLTIGDKWHFYGAFDSGVELMAYGPLSKKVGILLNVRRLWMDLFMTNPKEGVYQFPYIFDGNFKLVYKPTREDTFSLLAYGSMEGMEQQNNKEFAHNGSGEFGDYILNPNANENYDALFRYKDFNIVGGLTWERKFSSENQLVTTLAITPHFGNYYQTFNGIRGFDAEYTAIPFQAKSEVMIHSPQKHDIRAGATYYRYAVKSKGKGRTGIFTDSGFYTNFEGEVVYDWNFIEQVGVWAQDIFLIHPKLKLVYGVRLDYYSPSKEYIPQPRGGLSFEFVPGVEAAFHSGLYSRLDLPGEQNPPHSPDKATKTIHLLPSFSIKKDRVHFRAEAFYKNYDNLTEEDFTEKSSFNCDGEREVYGGDLYLKFSEAPERLFSGHISYTYQEGVEVVNKRGDAPEILEETYALPAVGKKFVPDYLRTHTLSASLNIMPFKSLNISEVTKKGKHNSWGYMLKHQKMGITLRALSGKPYTPVKDVVLYQHPDSKSKYLYLYGDYNSKRTPIFVNFDLKWTFPIDKNMESFLTILNVLPIENIIGYHPALRSSYKNSDVVSSASVTSLGKEAAMMAPIKDSALQIYGGFRCEF